MQKPILHRGKPTCSLPRPNGGKFIWQETGRGAYVAVEGIAVEIAGYEALDFFAHATATGYAVRDGYTGDTWGTGDTYGVALESARRTLETLHDLIPHTINYVAKRRGLSPRYITR